MKDMGKILQKAIKEVPAGINDITQASDLKEVVTAVAESLTEIIGTGLGYSSNTKTVAYKNAIRLEKECKKYIAKYGVYIADFVKDAYPEYYHLIEEAVKIREEKSKIKSMKKAGQTVEEVKEDIKQQETVQALGTERKIGYARVSTAGQNLDRQLEALEGVGCDYIYKEKVSGKDTERKQLKKMLNELKTGDVLVICEINRLARSTTDLFKIAGDLESRGVNILSLKESWCNTTTPQGKLMFTIMSGLAEFERGQILQRQQEGIKIAKSKGVKFGKQLNEKADIETAIEMYKEGKYTVTSIASMCHVSRTTLWRRLRDMDLLQK